MRHWSEQAGGPARPEDSSTLEYADSKLPGRLISQEASGARIGPSRVAFGSAF